MANTSVTLTLPARIHLAWLLEHHFLQAIVTLTQESSLQDPTATILGAPSLQLRSGGSLQQHLTQVWPLPLWVERAQKPCPPPSPPFPTHARPYQAKQKILPPPK